MREPISMTTTDTIDIDTLTSLVQAAADRLGHGPAAWATLSWLATDAYNLGQRSALPTTEPTADELTTSQAAAQLGIRVGAVWRAASTGRIAVSRRVTLAGRAILYLNRASVEGYREGRRRPQEVQP